MADTEVEITVMDARYCARALALGTAVELGAIGDRVAVAHGEHVFGYVAPVHAWVINCLRSGETLTCCVARLDVRGWPRKRAHMVVVKIVRAPSGLRAMTDRGLSAITDAGMSVGSGAVELGRRAASLGGSAADVVTRSAVTTARWGGETLVVRPAQALGRGIGDVADATLGRPLRRLKRLAMFTVGAIFVALVLLLLIVVIWRLPSLGVFGRLLGL